MSREEAIYAVYTLLFLIFVASILATPLLAESHDMEGVYAAFSYTCHQKMSRSLCIFNDGESRWIADCLPQGGEYIRGPEDKAAVSIERDGATGFKMPVCSRDIGLYAALLFGALVYPIVRELGTKKVPPAIYLVIAIVPLALDGGLQIVSELGLLPFLYESTNAMRLITGIIAGFVASFYAIPVLMNLFGKEKD